MIVGIDHIAISAGNLESVSDFFKCLGYEEQFREMNLTNLNIKKEFLNFYYPEHDLILFSKKGNYPVEIINHNSKGFLNKNQKFIPIIEGNLKLIPYKIISESTKIIGYKLVEFEMNHLRAYYKKTNASQLVLNNFLIEISNVSDTIDFYSKMGFFVKSMVDDLMIMEHKSLLSDDNFKLTFIVSNKVNEVCLDDLSFNCLGLISSSLEKDLNLFVEKYKTTPSEFLNVNGKILNIAFVKGPNGEIIELIGTVRKSK